jgi:uncharacterized protein
MFIETKNLQAQGRAVGVTFPCPSMEDVEPRDDEVRIEGRLSRGSGGVRLDGRLETRVGLVCARCAAVYTHPVSASFALLYRPPAAVEAAEAGEPEVALSAEDCALVALDEDGRIDLIALAREQIYLSLPLKPVCQPECRGLCSGCGVDRNQQSCSCSEPEPDPRLAVLAELKNRS